MTHPSDSWLTPKWVIDSVRVFCNPPYEQPAVGIGRSWGKSTMIAEWLIAPYHVPFSWADIRRSRRRRRRALLRRIREDRRPAGGRWYSRRESPT